MEFMERAERINWEEFYKSEIWQVLCLYLDDLREDGIRHLGEEEDQTKMRMLQGRIAFCLEMKDLPIMLDELVNEETAYEPEV